tara:strand:- start:1017 stop:1433 length:417 start_codon:yes stop_codon:yes gene_type:complete
MLGALLPVLGPIVSDVVGRVLPADKNKAQQLQNELNMAMLSNSAAIEQAAASVVIAEAKSEHTITATWRPILMLVITAIVGWNYLFAPLIELIVQLTTNNQIPLTIELPEELWTLLTVGVGGYIVGRSGEKVASKLKK